MKLQTIFLLPLVLLGLATIVQGGEPVEEQRAAVEAVKKLGGRVTLRSNRALKVSFRDTAVTDADFAPVGELDTVVNVAVFGSAEFKGPGLVHLHDLPQLQSLYLPETHVDDQAMKHLAGLTRLVNLYLPSTKISDAGLPHLKELKNLRVLYLDRTSVGDAGLESLRPLQLVALSLNGTKISDQGIAALAAQKNLSMLYLKDVEITDVAIEHLKGFTNLRHLDVTNTKISDRGAEQLSQALPLCKLVR